MGVAIYLIINLCNHKMYVGQTFRSLKKRWWEHCHSSRCRLLSRAIAKYGPEKFRIVNIVSVESKKDADDLERYYIGFFDAMNPVKGYNLDPGGIGGREFSVETRKRMSEAKLGKIQPHSKEWIEKMKAACSGHPHWAWTGASRAAISRFLRAHFGNPDHCENTNCGCLGRRSRNFLWVNMADTRTKRREDWRMLCRSCSLFWRNPLKREEIRFA
jgi:group I intron endonuclease